MRRASQPNARPSRDHLSRLAGGGALRAAALAWGAAGAIALVPGCSAGREEIALGTGSYAFISGEFLASAEGRPAEFAERAQAVLAQRAQGVTVRSRPTWSHVRGTLPDGREVVIFATRAGASAAGGTSGNGPSGGVSGAAEDQLRVSIRVGPLGDEAESVRLLEAIRARASHSGDAAPGAPAPAAPASGPR